MLQKIQSKDIFNEVKKSLVAVYEESEAQNIAFLLLEKLAGMTKQAIIFNKEVSSSYFSAAPLIEATIARLQHNEPLQYILEEAHFYGLDFKVSPAVLIPRPETEELVALIIQENKAKESLTILDVGTGSGCIPITLAKNLKNATVYAIDISEDALQIARENAAKYQAEIHFLHLDILQENSQNYLFLKNLTFDIIVSNPPYIREMEKEEMHANVLDYEPTQALFVPDKQPLLFYEKIALLAQAQLKEDGKLYFEINENFGKEVVKLLASLSFTEIKLVNDLQGKDRIVSGILKY